jgi:hypothetical protein
MTTTVLLWANGSLTPQQSTEINDHAEQMHLAGKTDNVKVVVLVDDDTKTQVTRTWTTLADAEEWLLFVEEYGPISATIQS